MESNIVQFFENSHLSITELKYNAYLNCSILNGFQILLSILGEIYKLKLKIMT